ncbi:hypothetical protein I4F81_010310 [Pyropia yezoensis]|uniref:Uncharacterized protein n=1 Tax=Pyropia yezoensis TaxID=2788 RepID=A0ACC3CC23_PYRYE|nr:hypothetical protein I4F81_010310 [Neopyropia yezoensis]
MLSALGADGDGGAVPDAASGASGGGGGGGGGEQRPPPPPPATPLRPPRSRGAPATAATAAPCRPARNMDPRRRISGDPSACHVTRVRQATPKRSRRNHHRSPSQTRLRPCTLAAKTPPAPGRPLPAAAMAAGCRTGGAPRPPRRRHRQS